MNDQSKSIPSSFCNKTLAGALALFGGMFGAHRLYLGWRFWWIYPLISMPSLAIALQSDEWIRHPGFLLAAFVGVVTLFEAILICLTRDEVWDARRNAGLEQHSSSGWGVVFIVIVSLMLAAIGLMSVIAIGLEGYFAAKLGRPR